MYSIATANKHNSVAIYLDKKLTAAPTFFMIPVFRFENVVYLRSLLSINSILILTLPLVFFGILSGGSPAEAARDDPAETSSSSSEDSMSSAAALDKASGSVFSKEGPPFI